MKRKFLKLTVGMFLLVGGVSVQAQTEPINVVTTAVPFLRISPDARAGGMGDLGVATSPDANAPMYNLAKIPFAQKNFSVGLTYTPWLKDLGLNDVYLLAMGAYYKLDDVSAIGGSIRYFSLGNIQLTDQNGMDVGAARPREFGIDAGYSRKLSDKLSLGVALRYIRSNLAGNAATGGTAYRPGGTVAGDLSLFYTGQNEVGQGWNFGATLTNLGGKIGYTNDATQRDYIPANLSLGATYTTVFDESNKITFGIDLSKLLVPTPPAFSQDLADSAVNNARVADYRNKSVVSSWFSSFGDAPGGGKEELKEIQASLGAEYAYNDQFFFRAGYFMENKQKGNRKYFTVGLGLKYNVFGLNFSYLVPSGSGVNRNPLSNTLRFGLIFDLDDISTGE